MRNTKQYRAYLMILLMMLNLFIFPFSFTVESTSIPTYIYAGGEDTNKVYQYFTSNLTKKTETADYGGYVLAITEDDTYVYAGGETTQKIYQYWKINLSKKAESADYGGTIRVIVQDSTYLYAGGEDIQKIYQYWKTNLSKKAESADYGGSIRALTQDTTYIYAGGGSTQEVHQYWKTNLTKKANSSSLSGDINAITQDTNYIYASVSFLNGNVYQLWKTNLTEKTRTVDYGGILDSITDDDTYVYSGGATQQTIQQYWKSNMTMKTESADYGGEIFSLTDDDTYVYAGGETTQKIYQYWKINLSKKAESADYGGTIKTISGLAGGVEIISPTVITTVSTGVGPSNATVYGQLTNDGGGNCTVGFEYGTTLGYGNYTEIPEYNTNYSAPIGKSNVSGRTVAFSPDGRFLAVGMTSSPFFAIFKKGDINKTWYKLPDPAIIPTDAVYEITFSHNGSYMAVGMYQSPRLYIYKYGVINETYYKIPDVISIPTGTLTDLAFSWNSTYLAWAQSSSPYFYLYKFSSSNSTYYQIANPSGITGACDAVEFSHNITNYMIVTRASAPYFKIFKYGSVNHTFYMITDPVQPTGRVYSVAFSSNNSLIAYSSSVYPYLGFYKYGKTNGTYYAISSPYDTGIGTGYKGIDFSSDDKYIAITGYRYNPVYFFKLNESTKQYYRLSYPSVQTAYNNYGNEVAFSKTSDELVAGTYGSPYLIIFSRYVRSNMTFKTELTDLRPATLYHYRAVANNSNGTVYGSDMTFTTTGSIVPVLTTNNATGVEETNATLNGTLNSCVPVRLHERYNLNNYRRVLVSLGEWYGQTFRVGSTGDNSSHVIKYVNLRLGRKAGESPGTVTAFLRLINETTNNPVGPNISIGTVNGNTFVENSDSTYTGSNAWVQINMTPCTLLPNTQYIIFIKSASVGLEWAETMTGLPSYFGREIKTTNQGSTYTNYTNYALLFEVYGEKIPSDTTVNFQYRNSSCVPYNIGLSSASGDDSYGQANMRLSKSYSTTGQTTVLVIYGYAELYNLPGHGVCLAKMGIYEGTTYITESKESTISDGYKGWVQFIFNSTTLLSQSTNYRIGIAVSSNFCGVKVPISASGDKIQTRGYSSGFPNPWTGVGDDGRIACLYLNVINIIVTVNQTKTSVGTFNQNVVSLLPGQLYHYRAVANNTNGTGYGSNKTFLTKPYGPLTNPSITRNSSGFTLAWTKSPTGNNTVIRGKIGSYPSSPTGDVAVYNGSGQTVNHFGLSSGDTWYYRAWSYKSWSGLNQYSDNYTQNNKLVINNSIVTTNDATGVEETNATLRGTLNDDGGENCTVGFEYGLTTSYGSSCGYDEISTETLYSDGNSTPQSFTVVPPGTYHYIATNSNDDDTSYIYCDTSYLYDFSTVANTSLNFSDIYSITTYCVAKHMGFSSSNEIRNALKIDGTNYYGPKHTTSTSYVKYEDTWNVNPKTGMAWSWTDINNLIIGVRGGASATHHTRVTYIYVNISYQTNISTSDNFSKNIGSLSPGSLYHYRAVANNTNGTGYGADKTFLTKPNEPTNLIITNTGSGQQTLTWTHGTGYNRSVVRRNTGTYPATPSSGTGVYNGTSSTTLSTGLTGGTTYYYRVWEYANESGLHQYSDTYTQGTLLAVTTPIVTTNNATGVEETTATLNGNLTNDGGTNYTIYENYTTGADSWANKYTSRWGAQTFTPGTTHNISFVLLKLFKVGNPGTITVSIRATNVTGCPTGPDLTNGTTDGNTLTTSTSGDWRRINLQSYALSSGIKYAIVARATSGDGANYFSWLFKSVGSYAGGTLVASANSGSTWYFLSGPATEDYMFQEGNGTDLCKVYFQYGLTTNYGTNTSIQYKSTGETFSYSITGYPFGPLLNNGTLYHYRAIANNSAGKANGSDKTFLTKPNAPTGLTATDINTNHTQHLTWAHGTGYNRSVVRVSTSGYPATPTSGTQAYNDTGTSCYYATPLPGQAYFYRAWEYANESGLHQFSDSYSSAYNLTKPNSPRNFTLNWTYDSLIPIGTSPDQIDITWIKGTGANRTIIVRKNNSYPTSITDGTLVYNGTGTNKLDTNLHVYVRYYYRAWSYTTWSGMNHYSNTGINLTLAETSNTTESLTTATTAHLYGYLITQPYTHQYRFNYGQGSYTTNTTTLYRNTTGVIQRNITGLTPGKLYQYRAYANDSNSNKTYGNKKYFLTRPLAPTNVNYSVYNSSAVNLTWTKGTGSNRTVIVMNHLHNPTSPTDGTIVYNGTGFYYHLPITPGTPYYCQAYGLATWTYNPTIWMFSGNGTNMTWTYLGVNCFNESKPTQALTFNIQFKDEYGQHTFTALGVTNTYILNISQIPTGADILIKVWATGYKERLTTIAVTPSTYYNLTFYLPPASTTTNGTGGGTTGDCVTRTATNSITVGNTTVDATITFSHPLNEMIQVERYNSSVDRTLRSYTDSKTITSNTNDVWIPLNHTKESIISVQVWNTTLYGTYGGWFPVPADKYTYVSGNNTIRINKTILNPTLLTITQGKVDYYYWGGGTYGAWQFVTETKYSYNTTTLTVNKTALDSFTTMLRVSYYWQDCPGQTITTPLYYCRVVETIRTEFSEFDRPVENAQVWFQTYINTTGKYVNVSTLLTDGNGYVTIYLLPSNLYQVIIRKTGYDNYRSDYIPPPATQYGQTTEKLFRVVRSGSTIPTINYTYLMQNITWSLLPPTLKQKGAITFTFTIASADNKIEWYNMTITFYNKTQRRWIQIFTQNDTNAGGGTITFTTPNVTGDYEVELWFKKTGYLAYQLFQTGSLRYTIYYISAWIKAIPDFVWYLVLVVIMIIIMGFCFTKLGTGLITGYIGLGVMAFGLLLKPDITVNGFSGWVIWAITFLIYTMGMFLWSRL